MPAQESQVLPVFGGMQLEPAQQAQAEFDFLINCNLSRGVLEARDGWRVIQTPDTWSKEDDGNVPPVERYVPATYKTAATESFSPLGAHLFTSPNGVDYIISITRPDSQSAAPDAEKYTEQCFAIVYTVNGKVVNLGGSDVRLANDRPGKPYVFAEYAHYLYFTNGGSIWRWSEFEKKITDVSKTFYTPANSQDQYAYFTEMRGASIIVEHLGRMVYAGFDNRQWLEADKTIDEDNTLVVVSEDAKKAGAKLSPDLKHVQAAPYMIYFSDFTSPRCVRPAWVSAMPTYRAITGLASFRKQLIVFTDTEMWVTNSPPAKTQKVMGVGCVAQRTIQQTRDGMLMWLAKDGIYAWNGSGLPIRISRPLDDMFSGRDANFGWPRSSALVGEDVHIPFIVSHSQLKDASAAVIGAQDTYCVALKGGSAVETNDLIICCHYPTKRLWFWVSAGLHAGGTEATPTDVVGSAMSGHYTLMGSKLEPDKLFSQSFHCFNSATQSASPSAQANHTAISVLDRPGAGDQKLTYSDGAPVIAEHPFEMIAISRRFHIGTASPKLYRQIRLRMYATRRHDFRETVDDSTPDVNKIELVLMPELAPFEAVNQLNTPSAADGREYSTTVNPWPAEFSDNVDSTYFWQPGLSGETAKGKWQADGGSKTTDTHYWVPSQPFDKRVDVRCPSTQFARVALRKIVDDESGASLRVMSLSVVVVPERGVAR